MVAWSSSLALLVGLSACGGQEQPEQAPKVRPVKTMVVGDGAAGALRTLPGRVEASHRVDLSFRVGGPLIELPVKEGDGVKQGQLVARIDPRDFRIRLNSSTADYERTKADFRRFSSLYEREAVSEAQLDQARAARDVARASLEDARAALEDSFLRAPFSGLVGKTFVENFEDVRPRQPILSLVDIGHVELVVDMPESLMAGIRNRSNPPRMFAVFDTAPGREFDLSLKEIAAQADPRTQTYQVTLIMPQPEGLLVLPGMTANVYARLHQGDESALLIPAVAVFADDSGESQVWLVERSSMTVSRQPVETSALSGSDKIQIVGGLNRGDTIAVTAVSQLREGMKIRELGELEGLGP
jgi:RND family efflux transporter MFP subunit